MQWLIYWVVGALLVATFAVAILVGGWLWVAPAIATPLAVSFVVANRRMKRREPHGERLSAEVHPDR